MVKNSTQKRNLRIAAILMSMGVGLLGSQDAKAATVPSVTVMSYSNLQTTIKDATSSVTMDLFTDVSGSGSLGTFGESGDTITLTINGNNYNIECDDESSNGITVKENGYLTVSGVGLRDGNGDITSAGFTGFTNGAIYVDGGAVNVADGGNATFIDTSFIDNTSDGNGGAINNDGTVNIVAMNKDVEFTGNQAAGEGDAIYNSNTTNLNAAEDKTIEINDTISGDGTGTININKPDIILPDGSTAPTTGTVEINNTVSNNTVTLNDGTLKLGENHDGTGVGNFDDTVDFIVNGGVLDLIDNTIRETNLGNVTLNSDLGLKVDANLIVPESDKITASSPVVSNGHNIVITDVNIMTDSGSNIVKTQIADSNLMGAVKLSTNPDVVVTGSPHNYSYLLTYNNTDGYLTYNNQMKLKDAVAATESDRVYTMLEDEILNANLGSMGGSSGAVLTIDGNNYSITAQSQNIRGITVGSGKTLNINNVGSLDDDGNVVNSWNGMNNTSTSIVGGVVYNTSGTVSVTDSVFKDNSSVFGGVIYNYSGTTSISGSTFINNSTTDYGGAIGNVGTITSLDADFIGNSAATYGGAIANVTLNGSSGKISSVTGLFLNNSAEQGGAIINQGEITSLNADFIGNSATINGGAINNNTNGVLSDVSGQFSNNTAGQYGGAIVNQGVEISISNSSFEGNTAISGGGAIANGSILTIDNTSFTGNNANKGGAIHNTGTMTLNNVTVNAGTIIASNDIYQTSAGATSLTGTNTIASAISGDGTITNRGNLNTSGDNSEYIGTYTQEAGTTTVVGTFFGGTSTIEDGTLNWYTTNDIPSYAKLIVENGTLNIGQDALQKAVLTLNSGSSIAAGVEALLNTSSSLNIAGGSVELDNADTWSGKIAISSGTLDINDVQSNGILEASGGDVTLEAGNLDLTSDSYIKEAVTTSLNAGTTTNITGGSVELDNADTWSGKIAITSGTLNINDVQSNGILEASGGNVTLEAGNLDLTSDSYIKEAVTTSLNAGTTTNITGGSVELDNEDTWSGKIAITDGTLNINNVQSNGILEATGGSVTLELGNLDLLTGSSIAETVTTTLNAGTTTNITGGSLAMNSNDTWAGAVNMTSGTLNTNVTSNGTITATGGIIEIEGGKLTIAGTSNVEGASNIIVDAAASLIFEKNSYINNITGQGGLTVDGSELTFDNNSHLDTTISFTSENNSTVTINSSTKADDVLAVVNAGSNTGLTINLNNSNASSDLNIDGTDITDLNFSGTVNYGGNLANAGIVTNSGILTLNGVTTGEGDFTNSGTININADQSGFTGNYTQLAGSANVNVSGKVFGGEKNINGGSLNITSSSAIDYDNVHLASGTELNHTATTNANNTINSSVVDFTGEGASANFGASSGIVGNYNIEEKIDNGQANTLSVDNSVVTLGSTDYTGSTTYNFTNSDLNLIEEGAGAATKDYTFTNLTTDNTTLSFNVNIVDGATEGTKALETDTVTIENGSDDIKFGFGNIYITGEENGNPEVYHTVKDVLTGATFADQPDENKITWATGATTSWEYEVTATDDKHSIQMQVTNFSDENTLYKMNATEGTRFFQFSDDGSDSLQTYHIDQSLSATVGQTSGVSGQASFTVTGHDRDKNIISGEIYDKTTHTATGDYGSFFNIADDVNVKLDIKDLTIQDAQKTGNGSVVENNSQQAIVTLDNVGIKNNTSTGNGGAIYNGVMPENTDDANLIISGSVFDNNTAAGNGGAIYNAGNMAITDTEFTNNAADKGGAIYNKGTMTLNNVTVAAGSETAKNDIYQESTGNTVLTGTNTIASNIAGEGTIINQGTLNTSGDNSGYTGTYTQEAGTTTVTGTFFGGNSTVENGTLNWYTENDIPSGTLNVTGGTLNLGKDKDQNSVLTLADGSSIADVVKTTINENSTLNVAGGSAAMNSNDTWTGKINLTDGDLTVNNIASNGTLDAAGGKLTLETGKLDIAAGSTIAGAVDTTLKAGTTTNINGGSVELGNSDDWAGKITMNDGSLNINDVQSNGALQASGGDVTLEAGNLDLTSDSYIKEAVNTTLNTGTTTNITGGSIELDKADTWSGKITINDGTLNINDVQSNGALQASGGDVTLEAGNLELTSDSYIKEAVTTTLSTGTTTNITGGSVELDKADTWSGKIAITDGALNINDVQSNGTLQASGGDVTLEAGNLDLTSDSYIKEAVNTTLNTGTTTNITGGSVELDNADTWSGKIAITDGTLNINDVQSNGTLQATGGDVTLEAGNLELTSDSYIKEAVTTTLNAGTTTNITGGSVELDNADTWSGKIAMTSGTLSINNVQSNDILEANGGNLTLKAGELNLTSDSYIKEAVNTTINAGTVTNITGGSVELDKADIWSGSIKITDGTLDINNIQGNGNFIAEGGTVNLNAGDLTIAAGSKIVGDGNNPAVTLTDNTNLNITGGDVTLNSNDTWNGNINITSGTLNVDDISSNGTIHAADGNLNINTNLLTVENGSYIDGAVKTVITETTTVDIKKQGTVTINTNDTWDGTIELNGGTLNYGTTHDGTLIANTGNLNLLDKSILTIEVPSQVKDAVNVDIQKGSLVNLRTDAEFNLDTNDKWNGMINNDGGKLTTTELVNNTNSGGGLQQISGSATFRDNSHILINDANSYITGGDVNILNNSSLILGGSTQDLSVDTLTMANNSTLGLMNGTLNTSTIDNMVVNGNNNITVDISPRDWNHDKFLVNTLSSDMKGTIKISDFDFVGLCPIDKQIKLHLFDAESIKNVTFDTTDKEIFTPIGYYDLKSVGGGWFTSNKTRWNPQVFRGQVATMSMYNNQLAIDDMLLNHVTLQSERFLSNGKLANRYAINDSRFAPYQYTKEDGGLWYKSYVNFETLSMTHNLNVHNTAYGSFVGADFPVVKLKRGWEFIPTAFIGYNGSHQSFNNVSMYQNGGQGGFMGTFMKDDFVGSVMAYGGGYNNEMSVAGFNDKAGNWFAGTAAKAAYNLHATEHFTVQPTAFLSYNVFGRQNWGTDFGTMSMNSGMLNGVNVAPGVNFIYARESWNVYATVQYMYNINDHLGGHAGNVSLAQVSMKHGYLQYGFGATKTWKDRMNAYFQILFRNGGRTGVGFQLGAQYLFDWGKTGKTTMTKKDGKVKQQTEQVSPDKKVIKSLSKKEAL